MCLDSCLYIAPNKLSAFRQYIVEQIKINEEEFIIYFKTHFEIHKADLNKSVVLLEK